MPNCKVENCDRKSRSRDMCKTHYVRFMKGQPLDKPIRKWKARSHNAKCEVTNCNRDHFADGLCTMHYHRRIRKMPFDLPFRTRREAIQ